MVVWQSGCLAGFLAASELRRYEAIWHQLFDEDEDDVYDDDDDDDDAVDVDVEVDVGARRIRCRAGHCLLARGPTKNSGGPPGITVAGYPPALVAANPKSGRLGFLPMADFRSYEPAGRLYCNGPAGDSMCACSRFICAQKRPFRLAKLARLFSKLVSGLASGTYFALFSPLQGCLGNFLFWPKTSSRRSGADGAGGECKFI